MTRYPSPAWHTPHRSRAAAPRNAQDYELLATIAACRYLPPDEVSRLCEFEEDYGDRLFRSAAGQAFTSWFRSQSSEFIEGFRLNADSLMEARIQIEREKIEAESEIADPCKEALKELGFITSEEEES